MCMTATEIRVKQEEHGRRIVKFEYSLRSALSNVIPGVAFTMYHRAMCDAVGNSIP